jgi:hypothetical protein
MFSIIVTPPAISELNTAFELLIEKLAKEPPAKDEATREIDMTPQLMDLNGVWSAGILPAN